MIADVAFQITPLITAFTILLPIQSGTPRHEVSSHLVWNSFLLHPRSKFNYQLRIL